MSDREGGSQIEIVSEPIGLAVVKAMTERRFGDMVKAVVDVGKGVMALGGELHSDEETLLLDQGSKQSDLWGINLYPDQHPAEDWIEFDSMINIRPSQGNRSRSVEDPGIQQRIRQVVAKLVKTNG